MLSTEQIRELMGSVPNTVFERLMEAVAAAESAPLMEQLNMLLNCRAQPACRWRGRWCAICATRSWPNWAASRRSCCEISADERARAARTALLFTEEELTRNLQIVLRTFDDLNYRQEQRFHLELGLLKLIHAQRLLPIEELLSGVASWGDSRRGQVARPSACVGALHAPARTASAAAPRGSRRGARAGRLECRSGREANAAVGQDAAIVDAGRPRAAASRGLHGEHGRVKPHPFLPWRARQPGTPPLRRLLKARWPKRLNRLRPTGDGLSIEHVREAVVAALATAGHSSAAQLLGAGEWRLDGASVRVAVPGMGKKMLSLTVNAAAEKIIRQELQRLGAPARFLVAAGAGTAPAVVAPPVAPAGSVQEAALAHPLVKRAQEIFKAEVRSVVDLRQK